MAELAPDGRGFFVTFTVEEGPRYKFGEIAVETLRDLEPEPAARQVADRGRRTYDAAEVDDPGNLTDVVGRARLRLRRDRAAGATINPREDAHGRPHLRRPRGSARLCRADRHRRQCPHARQGHPPRVPGGRRRRLQHCTAAAFAQRLHPIWLFRDRRRSDGAGSAPDQMVIEVAVTEQSTGELSFGAGFRPRTGVLGDVSLRERNLLGNGQDFAPASPSRSAGQDSSSASPSPTSSTATSQPASTCSARTDFQSDRRRSTTPAPAPGSAPATR